MTDETVETPKSLEEMSPEQIAELEKQREEQKAKMMEIFEEELPFLRLQAEYEECITRVETAKMQRLEIMLHKAQMMAPPPGEDGEKSEKRTPRREE